MGRPHIVRYHRYKNQGTFVNKSDGWINTPDIHESYSSWEIHHVGYVVVYDISGSSYCEERECPLYEITTTYLLKHTEEDGKAVRASRRIVTYGFAANQLSNRLLPELFEWMCTTCHAEQPAYNRICFLCKEYKHPFILIPDCFTRPAIADALAPQTYHIDARYGTRPFKEELVAAAWNPNRKDLWRSVLDYEEAKDLEATWKLE
jgi:hypothetical protein